MNKKELKDLELLHYEPKQEETETKVLFNDLKVGDTINYDLELKNGNLKNITETVLQKDNDAMKLSKLNVKWYCTQSYFNQLKNVSIVYED